MLFIALMALFGNGYQYQRSFDVCLEKDFQAKECRYHENNVKNNKSSMHHKK